MGYGKKQIKDLEKTINRVKADIVIDGTPADIKRFIKVNKPFYYAGYDIQDDQLLEVYKRVNKIIS